MSFQVPFHEVHGEKEEGSYIIKLKPDANKQSIFDWMNLEYSEGGSIVHEYNESNFYHGFAARCNQDLLSALRSRTDIEYISEDSITQVFSTTHANVTLEPDDTGSTAGSSKAHGIDPVDAGAALPGNKVNYITTSHVPKKSTKNDATWGLHRISHKGVAEEPYKYVYPGAAGEGVVIYVLDTGVYIQHSEFEGRASYGISFQGDPDDKHGHGTHVSGTAIGKTYGAAKKAKVVSVKVLNDDGKGSVSTMIAGIDWVVQQTFSPSPSVFGITAIINMSCGAWADDALDDAVTIAALFGVVPVVAAGNDGGDASERSPSRADAAFTVGSINVEDHLAHNSNHGDCVNIYAPGSKILSAGIGDRDATAYKSGTSMATPHVSGTFALYLSLMGTERPGLPASWLKGIPYSVLKGIVTVKSDETKEGLNVVQVP